MVYHPPHRATQVPGFLITLGVPIAAWCGVMLADIALRRRDYAEPDLFNPGGRYGDIRWIPVLAIGFVVTLAFSRAAVRAEEAASLPTPARAGA